MPGVLFSLFLQVLYYSTQVFESAGVQESDVATVALGAVLVIFATILVRRHMLIYHKTPATPLLVHRSCVYTWDLQQVESSEIKSEIRVV